jgi:hypothetical protein
LPPEHEDEDLPPAKRARLQASTGDSTAANKVTTGLPDDTPTGPVTPAALLPSAAASPVPQRRWKGKEDAKLMEAVRKHGKDCWVTVAALVPGRTDKQCRNRWVKSLYPTDGTKKGKWEPEDDTKLTEAIEKHGTDWVAVASLVPGRTNEQCRTRWVGSLDPANGK